MKEEKLGQEPAFASSYDLHTGFDSLGDKEFTRISNDGMSKRFYAACAAMQGLISGHYKVNTVNNGFPEPCAICEQAYQFADELLRQE